LNGLKLSCTLGFSELTQSTACGKSLLTSALAQITDKKIPALEPIAGGQPVAA